MHYDTTNMELEVRTQSLQGDSPQDFLGTRTRCQGGRNKKKYTIMWNVVIQKVSYSPAEYLVDFTVFKYKKLKEHLKLHP